MPTHKGLCVDVGVSVPANTKTISVEGRAWDRAGWADTKCFPACVPWSRLSEQHQTMEKPGSSPNQRDHQSMKTDGYTHSHMCGYSACTKSSL